IIHSISDISPSLFNLAAEPDTPVGHERHRVHLMAIPKATEVDLKVQVRTTGITGGPNVANDRAGVHVAGADGVRRLVHVHRPDSVAMTDHAVVACAALPCSTDCPCCNGPNSLTTPATWQINTLMARPGRGVEPVGIPGVAQSGYRVHPA